WPPIFRVWRPPPTCRSTPDPRALEEGAKMQRTKLFVVLAYTLLLPALALAQASPAASRSAVDGFFARFTDEWVRADPDLATSSRYFSGEEQSQLEQQLTPRTRA